MSLRPFRGDDAAAVVELMNAASLSAYGTADTTEAELRRWLTTPDVVPERDIRVAEEEGRLVGYADVDPTDTEPVRNWCNIVVHPDASPDAWAPRLVAWCEERAGGGILRTWAPSVATELRAAFERLGLELVRHSYRMQIDLDREPDPPQWPDGISVRTFAPEDAQLVHAVHQETFADSWEHNYEPYDEWAHWLLEREEFDPSLWFLAEGGAELAGILLAIPRETDPAEGYVQILGVRRPWRRAGLGRALLHHAFREFHARDFERVVLGVDASSLTGAERLYENAGMKVVRQFDFYEKKL